MLRYLKEKGFMTCTLIFTSLLMYFAFLIIDILTKTTGTSLSIYLKYGTVFIFFLTSLFINNQSNLPNLLLLRIALFFTLCADTCLLIVNHYSLGIVFFIIVQTIYIVRHSIIGKINIKLLLIPVAIIFISPVFISIVSMYLPKIDATLIQLGIIYGTVLITGLLVAQKCPKIISYAMILFFLCDINVALSYVLYFYPIYVLNISMDCITNFLIWTFYFPSQLLLTLSGMDKIKCCKRIK